MGKETRCKYCPCTIKFVTTQNGKQMPIEVEPLSTADFKFGEYFITQDGRTIKNSEEWVDFLEDVYRPHFGNCSVGLNPARRSH